MDVKTLRKIRRTESGNKRTLSELPSNFYNDCREALDHAFKSQNYDDFRQIQLLLKNVNEMRHGKILRFAIYRASAGRMGNAEPVLNILPEEQKLLDSFLLSIHQFNDDFDIIMDGYYFQEVHYG